jgi:CheY-like chemotaxis protein
MQPDAIRNNQLSPTAGINQSQLYIIVSFYVLIRHNLHILRNYRNDYLSTFHQRLDFLPQGVDNAPSNPSQDRMIILAQKVLLQMTQMAVPKDHTVTGQPVESLPNHPSSAALSAVVSASTPLPSSKYAAACSAISTLVCFLQSSGTASSSSTVCNLSEICQAAISQCKPLLKKRVVSLNFLGHRPFVPLRVLVVDDSALVRRFLERLLRNRGYYYHSCPDGECSVKAFQNSLQGQPQLHNRFDLILMDKDMPTSCPDGHQSAGMSAVKMIRELSRLQTEVEPGFRCPCIIGNSACTDEDDSTWIMFRNELELSRRHAGIPCNLLILKEKMSTWSDSFDVEVRQLCGLGETLDSAEMGDAPTVWGNPIRLEMMFRNLITNAIQYGKPSVGEHYVNLSYDIIDRQSLVHPCLMLSDQDNEVARSLTWQLSFDFKERTQRYVQVMVTDNGPGIDIERMRTRPQSSSDFNDVAQTSVGGVRASAIGSVSNFGVCLQRIVCPEVARCHGAMGVHSRIEPSSGCSFVVALPYCSPAVRS